MASGNDPHDRLARHTLSVPANALSVLEAVLPQEVRARIDLSTLQLRPGSFVDRAGESRTDLLFSAKMGQRRALIYVLLEHQSRADPSMPLRVLVYMSRIWQRLQREKHRPLPVIVPVVLHHGESGWSAPRRLGELLDWSEAERAALQRYVPDLELLIDDLPAVPERALAERAGTPLGRLVVWVLRAVRVGYEPELLEHWAKELSLAGASGEREALLHVLQYLLGTDEGSALYQALARANLGPEVQEIVMGLQQRWMEEAAAKGRAEGKAEGKAELLLKLLRLRFGDAVDAVEPRVRRATDDELDRWAERVLSAGSLEDVFA